MTHPRAEETVMDMPEEISVKKEMETRGHYSYDVIGHGNITGYTTYHRADLPTTAQRQAALLALERGDNFWYIDHKETIRTALGGRDE